MELFKQSDTHSSNSSPVYSVFLWRRCTLTVEVYMFIDLCFTLFGLERGQLSLWLCCTIIPHIFHDCVEYRTANHMCYPLSAALLVGSFFLTLLLKTIFIKTLLI